MGSNQEHLFSEEQWLYSKDKETVAIELVDMEDTWYLASRFTAHLSK